MLRTAFRALLATVVLAVVTGLLYPLGVTLVAQLALPERAAGSLRTVGETVVGSDAIGQEWRGDAWFHGRPSAVGYDASTSGGSNLGPSSTDLRTTIEERLRAVIEREGPYVDGLAVVDVPVDLVTASASGLDPDISVEAARLQAPRIAAVRGLPLDVVLRLIDDATSGPTLGFLGVARVNVLDLNLSLDTAAART